MIQMRTRSIACIAFLVAAIGSVGASDVARFVNLGFSPDSRVFMFAQHGISQNSNTPYADVFTVDVPQNSFVSGGVISETYQTPISPGQDGTGALFTLLPRLQPVVSRFGVNHLAQGRPVYIRVNGEETRDRIEFRDFESGSRYVITMTQEARGEGTDGSAAFYLDVEIRHANGTSTTHRVGRPGFFRTGVNRYRVGQVLVAPDERSLIMVVERVTDTPAGRQVRFMVETLRP